FTLYIVADMICMFIPLFGATVTIAICEASQQRERTAFPVLTDCNVEWKHPETWTRVPLVPWVMRRAIRLLFIAVVFAGVISVVTGPNIELRPFDDFGLSGTRVMVAHMFWRTIGIRGQVPISVPGTGISIIESIPDSLAVLHGSMIMAMSGLPALTM